MVDGTDPSPWEQAAPTPATRTQPLPSDRTTGNPPEPRTTETWGAAPVGVPRGTGGRLRPVVGEQLAVFAPTGPGVFGPTELLRLRERDRTTRAREIEQAGWPGPRTVLVASLYGGVGASTLAAQMAWAGRQRGLPTVLLDASEAYGAGVADRIPETGRMSQQPSWADLAQMTAESGPDALSRAFGERLPGLDAAAPVLVGGRQPAGGLRHRPSAGLLAQVVRGVQAGGWPLAVVDHGAGVDALTASLRAFDPDLLVLLTRGDAAEMRETATFLRVLASSDIRSTHHTVLAIAHDGRLGRSVSAARASVLDAAAGSIDAPWTERLRDRTTTVDAVPAPISLLMAALAISTPTHHRSGRSTQ